MGSILVVEDEADIAKLVKYHLAKEGLQAHTVGDGKPALDLAMRNPPDLVILDLMLPGVDGLEVCRRLRANEATKTIPIIMLTAMSEEVDRILGLELGADDYVSKPFSPRELVARVKAVLRRLNPRTSSSDQMVLALGNLRLDPIRHLVTRAGQAIDLSAMEFRLLEFLLRHPGHVYTRSQLLSLSTLGGIRFAYRYLQTRSLPAGSLEHAPWGDSLITIGIGSCLYSGAIREFPL
jgi:two-component system alkaline phosphatase synthesis response regulator PhoP